ncbi:MAG: hypothetical protein KIT17_23150 [Rubrivivax sp.]|nr:hypothetical protein [Rubrivivax sp.]
MHLAIWIVTALLVGFWTLVAWGVSTLLGLATGAPGLPAEWYEWLGSLPGAVWLDVWMPGWREGLVWAAQVFGAAVGWLGDAAPVLVWVVWGLGAAALVLCAALLSGLVALVRRSSPPPPPAAPMARSPG